MKKMKKLISFLLTLGVLLGMTGAPAISNAASSQSDEMAGLELRHAADLGFDVSRSDEASISGQEMMQILDHFMEIAAPDKLGKWNEQLEGMRNSKNQMRRAEGMAACYLAAACAGGKYVQVSQDLWDEIAVFLLDAGKEIGYTSLSQFFFGKELSRNFNIGFGSWDLISAAYYFNLSRKSPCSGEFPIAYDYKENSLHLNQKATYKEGLLAAVRLYDIANADSFSAEDDANAFRAVFPETLLKKANGMPAVSPEDHPYWTGFAFLWEQASKDASEKAIYDTARWGFNCVRLYVDYRLIFQNGDYRTPNYSGLRILDRFIAVAMENQIHLDMCVSHLPGHALGDGVFNVARDMDLFKNKKKQEQVDEIWRFLTRRYQQIPNSCLSFSPIFEPSMGVSDVSYGIKEIANYTSHLIHVIREEDPDRLIIYEATGVTIDTDDSPERVRKAIKDKDNLILIRNYAEEPFVYYNMMDQAGYSNVDDVKHSMLCPTYPFYLYAVGTQIDKAHPLQLKGNFPEGTTVTVYIEKSSSAVICLCDAAGDELIREKAGNGRSKTDAPLSRAFPYAQSDKRIEYTTTKPETLMTLSTVSGSFTWCGIDVTFPPEYAVEKWYNVTDYDVYLGLEKKAGASKRTTSTVSIAPTPLDAPGVKVKNNVVSIDSSLQYSTDTVAHEASPAFSNWWASHVKELGVSSIVRFECADFSGAVWPDIARYYESLLTAFRENGLSWLSNDYSQLTGRYEKTFPQSEMKQGQGYKDFNEELLKLLQRFQ